MCVSDRYPRTQPAFPRDIAIPAHIGSGASHRERGCSHTSRCCQPRGVGAREKPVIDRPKSDNESVSQGVEKITQWPSDEKERISSGICKSAAVSSSQESQTRIVEPARGSFVGRPPGLIGNRRGRGARFPDVPIAIDIST